MSDLVRPAAVAGRFYRGNEQRLRSQVDDLLGSVRIDADEPLAAAYVVPHAGLIFSGQVAAEVYARLRHHRSQIDRVVLLGPSHFVPLQGMATSPHQQWQTPLGDQRVAEASGPVAPFAPAHEEPHAREHSLEVQVPFIQRALGDVEILPIAVGVSEEPPGWAVAAELAATPGSVVLCSTDLSHFHDAVSAESRDEQTVAAMSDCAWKKVGSADACGVFALRAVLAWGAAISARTRLYARTHSGVMSGDNSRVVGYAAMGLFAT